MQIFKIVTATFWSLFAIDRNLIYPKLIESVVPRYQNHLVLKNKFKIDQIHEEKDNKFTKKVHTLPLIGVLLDSIFTKHSYHKSFLKGVTPTVIFGLGYIIW